MLVLRYFDAAYTIATNGALLRNLLRRLGGWGLYLQLRALTFAKTALDGAGALSRDSRLSPVCKPSRARTCLKECTAHAKATCISFASQILGRMFCMRYPLLDTSTLKTNSLPSLNSSITSVSFLFSKVCQRHPLSAVSRKTLSHSTTHCSFLNHF
jgi:hypothetical protein